MKKFVCLTVPCIDEDVDSDFLESSPFFDFIEKEYFSTFVKNEYKELYIEAYLASRETEIEDAGIYAINRYKQDAEKALQKEPEYKSIDKIIQNFLENQTTISIAVPKTNIIIILMAVNIP